MVRRLCLAVSRGRRPCILRRAPPLAATCSSLTGLSLPHASVTLAQAVPAGSFTAPNGQTFNNLPAFCRLVVVSTPSPDSHIGIEVWMPDTILERPVPAGRQTEASRERSPSRPLAGALTAGYAAAGTDDGHTGGTANLRAGTSPASDRLRVPGAEGDHRQARRH